MKRFVDKENIKLINYLNYKYNFYRGREILFFLNPKVILFIILRIVFIFLRLVSGGYNHYFFSNNSNILKPQDFIDLLLYRRTLKVSVEKFNIFPLPKNIKSINNIYINLDNSANPEVSIIIPVFNKWQYTYNCIRAISENTIGMSYEVIIIDDKSTDETNTIFSKIKGVKYVKNEENLGFVQSCNKGASLSTGKYLCFLNNDTQVQKNWLITLLDAFKNNKDAGLVGSKFIYPNGILQEAGGIIWKDGSGYNYGRMKSPIDPDFNYLREVDYCSGASILIENNLFKSLGGFDLRFIPAYYEDTDLCFQVRSIGKKVYYQPKSEIIHFEGITSGTSLESGTKRYQVVNKEKFLDKWNVVLSEKHFSPLDHDKVYFGANRLVAGKAIIVIDSYVPRFDRESGSNRLFQLVKMMKELGYHIIYVPDNGYPEEPYTSILQNLGVQVLYNYDDQLIFEMVEKLAPFVDLAWVCRPELNQKYSNILRINSKLRLIYDTIDLHYIRLKREQELNPIINDPLAISWENMKKLEFEMAKQADLVITVTGNEMSILNSEINTPVSIVPNIHIEKDYVNKFEDRDGLLFIGSYDHIPNRDAVKWLVYEIMPYVWDKYPNLKLTLLGNNPTTEILNLASDKVFVPGYISDVSEYFINSKVFVCPLRYGAGMKGKIGQSLEYKLPIVSTSFGVEGMPMNTGIHYLEGNIPEDFANAIIKLVSDKVLWESISNNSFDCIRPYSFDVVKNNVNSVLNELSRS